jgi:hypothetical protein
MDKRILAYHASKTLQVFASAEDVIANVEGMSIAEGDWLFFTPGGEPLEPRFSEPARFLSDNTFTHGVYTLHAGVGRTLQQVMLDHCSIEPIHLWTFAEMEAYFKGP